MSPSGTALTAAQQAVVAPESAGPPVLCPDGDSAGRRAALSWVMEMTVAGREVLGVTLPDGHDPASWLEIHGADGLIAFERKGCLDAGPCEVRPVHAGRFLAEAGAGEGRPLARLRPLLSKAGACLDSEDARRRFADQAGRGLAQAGMGPDGWLARAIAAEISRVRQVGTAPPPSTSAGIRM